MGLAQARSAIGAGNQNRRRLLQFADQPLGRAFKDFAPRIWPGVPWQAFLGFITSANLTDNTTDGDPRQAFHEIGVGQVPAGPRGGPAPNPDPRAPNNAWGRLATDPDVVAVLGRPAVTAPNAWKAAPVDQAAMTIANLRSDYRAAKPLLDPSIRPTRDDTPWSVAVAYTAFSAGPGGAARFFNRYKTQLAAVPEADRWTATLQLLANGVRDGSIQPGAPGVHGNPFYDALRTWQKMESARQLAQGTHGDEAFFTPRLANAAATDDAIVAGARGEHPSNIAGLTRETLRGGGAAATGGLLVAGLAAVVTGLAVAYQRRRTARTR